MPDDDRPDGQRTGIDPLDDPVGAVRERVPDALTVPEADRGRRIVHEPTGTELVSSRRFEPTRWIDDRSEFADPFERALDAGGRPVDDEVSDGLYEGWFQGRLLESPAFAAAVDDLRGERLGCHCLPRPCHGEVILVHVAGACEK